MGKGGGFRNKLCYMMERGSGSFCGHMSCTWRLPNLSGLTLDVGVGPPDRRSQIHPINLEGHAAFNIVTRNCAGFVESAFEGLVTCTINGQLPLPPAICFRVPKFCKATPWVATATLSEEEKQRDVALLLQGFHSSIMDRETLVEYIRKTPLKRAFVIVKHPSHRPDTTGDHHALVGLIFERDEGGNEIGLTLGRLPGEAWDRFWETMHAKYRMAFGQQSVIVVGDGIGDATRKRNPHVFRITVAFDKEKQMQLIKDNLIRVLAVPEEEPGDPSSSGAKRRKTAVAADP